MTPHLDTTAATPSPPATSANTDAATAASAAARATADPRSTRHDAQPDPHARFAHDDTVPASVAARTGRPYFHESPADAETEFPGLAPHMRTAGTGALANLPLTVAGRSFGVVCVAWAKPREIDADTRALLGIVAGAAAQALQRGADIDAQLARLADHR